jgi:hypothetical protein
MAQQTQTPNARQLPYFVAVIGAFLGAALFYAFTMDVAVALVLGSPIGLLTGFIAYRAIPRMMHRDVSQSAKLNGAAPAPPTIEEQAKPAYRMKIKN